MRVLAENTMTFKSAKGIFGTLGTVINDIPVP